MSGTASTERLSALPLFLLNTVLFPGGRLALRIFEPRYVDMVADCMKHDQPFGVCLIASGHEVGPAGTPFPIGTLARVTQCDAETSGILHLLAAGTERFEIVRHWTAHERVTAEVRVLPSTEVPVPPEFSALASLLKRLDDDLDHKVLHAPHRFEDAEWVSARLSEILPAPNLKRQRWLEASDALARLKAIRDDLER